MPDFDRALPFVLKMEGGYVNDPDDRGGATNKGITQATYNAYCASTGVRPVREITDAEVGDIYRKHYWLEAHCDKMSWPLSLVVFDLAVNSGSVTALKMLQVAAGVVDDGKWGPNTAAAVQGAPPKVLAGNLMWARVDRYYRISTGTQVKFLRGWLRRLIHLRGEM